MKSEKENATLVTGLEVNETELVNRAQSGDRNAFSELVRNHAQGVMNVIYRTCGDVHIAGGLFIAPLFFTLAFSPWLLLGSWQAVYTSTVWTLTYREIKALPALASPVITTPPPVEPAVS